MKTYKLNDTDGYLQRFLDVVITTDPFGDPAEVGAIRTVFAWGHPVLKIQTPEPEYDEGKVVGQPATTWWWIGLDLGPETDQTRHREVVANFLRDTGMLTPITTPEEFERTGEDPVENAMENFAGALGTSDEADQFATLTEMIGEHEPDVFVDRVIHETPYFIDEVE